MEVVKENIIDAKRSVLKYMTFWKITFTPIFPTKDSTGFITYMIYLTDKGLDNSFAEYATKSKTYGKK